VAQTSEAALRAFADALQSRDGTLRRDGTGALVIRGSRGSIAAAAGGFLISFTAATPWHFALATMPFAEVVQDDGVGGRMLMTRLPTERESQTIRARIGAAKRR
jgi:hypothetical protein